MRRLWLPVLLLGWLFVLVGCGSLARAIAGYVNDADPHGRPDAWIVGTSGLVALAGGVLLLRRRLLGRWVCAGWMAAHIGISLLHGLAEVLTHTLLFAVIVLVLWNPRSSSERGSQVQ